MSIPVQGVSWHTQEVFKTLTTLAAGVVKSAFWFYFQLDGKMGLRSKGAIILVSAAIVLSSGQSGRAATNYLPAGKVSCDQLSELRTATKICVFTGVTDGGFAFHIGGDSKKKEDYAHISAKDNNLADVWNINCSVDMMNDRRTCMIQDGRVNFLFLYRGTKNITLCVRGQNYPGTVGLVRLDSAAPIQTSPRGCLNAQATARIIAKMRPGVVVRTRNYDWPESRPDDSETPLNSNFSEVFSLAEFLYRGGASTIPGLDGN